jgi:hypothetical protein
MFRTSVESVIKKTKVFNENETRFTRVCQTLVYVIISDPETSNLRLSEFTKFSLETSDISRIILNTIGQSFHILLENLHHILNLHNGYNIETDLQWVLALLLYSSQFARKMTANNVVKCHDELISIWFLVMEKQVHLSKDNRQNIQLNKITSCLQMITMTLSKVLDTHLFMSNLIMNEIWIDPERERYWDPVTSSPKITSELQMNMQRELSVLKTTEMIVDKNQSFVDRKVVFRPRLKLYRKNWTSKKPITNETTNKDSWQLHFPNSVTG